MAYVGSSNRTKYDGTTIGYGSNALTHVIIDNSSSNVTVSNTAFKWTSGKSNSDICWLSDDDPTSPKCTVN